MWTLIIRESTQHRKPGEGETRNYAALVLDKANYGVHPVTIPLSSVSVGEDAWRWVEARSIHEAVRNYADVRKLRPAPKKDEASTERKPTKQERLVRYAEERLDDAEPTSVITVADLNEDYVAWHQSTYGSRGDAPARNTFTRAMKAADRKPRFGKKGGVDIVKSCRFKPSADDGESGTTS